MIHEFNKFTKQCLQKPIILSQFSYVLSTVHGYFMKHNYTHIIVNLFNLWFVHFERLIYQIIILISNVFLFLFLLNFFFWSSDSYMTLTFKRI